MVTITNGTSDQGSGPRFRLLVVDDEPSICEFVRDVAEPLGYDVDCAGTGKEFRTILAGAAPDVVLLDLKLPDADGIELLRFIAEHDYSGELILFSGVGPRVLETAERLATAAGLSVVGHLAKPVAIDDLTAVLTAARPNEKALLDADALHAALAAGELFLEYQPKSSLPNGADGRIVAVEALIRWHHPQLGLVRPDRFIPLVEADRELSLLVTDFVLVEALGQARRWERGGTPITVTVNLPAILLDDETLTDRVMKHLCEAGVPAELLMLEVTETGTASIPQRAMETLARLRVQGVGLSIDDFGTGNSSLLQLYRLPFSELKVDRSFVFDLAKSEEARVIVRSIINLGHGLGMTVCAEGVETEETVELLHAWGCDTIQGFHISAPTSARRITALLECQTQLALGLPAHGPCVELVAEKHADEEAGDGAAIAPIPRPVYTNGLSVRTFQR